MTKLSLADFEPASDLELASVIGGLKEFQVPPGEGLNYASGGGGGMPKIGGDNWGGGGGSGSGENKSSNNNWTFSQCFTYNWAHFGDNDAIATVAQITNPYGVAAAIGASCLVNTNVNNPNINQ